MSASEDNRFKTTDEMPACEPSIFAQLVPTLTLVYGPDTSRIGERVYLAEKTTTLGRGDPVFPSGLLNDLKISRRHAEVFRARDGRFRLVDLGSKNGTFLNMRKIPAFKEVPLSEGDVIRLGGTLLLFHTTMVPRPQDVAEVSGIDACSDAARLLKIAVARYACEQATVLIEGETGSGKEVVAEAFARLGRPNGPFLTVNAAATPPTLIESILFGHERGAFTDAKEGRRGLFRDAHSGTLFLDEVGELPLDVQAKLLRVLEEGKVLPLGSSRAVAVDVRVVSATNRTLIREVEYGRFRGDLYARLAGALIRVPPLRERKEDISVIALKFSAGRPFKPEAMNRLLLHPWPFNVRELRTVVQQMLVEQGNDVLDLTRGVEERLRVHESLFAVKKGEPPSDSKYVEEKERVAEILRRNHGNVTHAAREYGRDRTHFYRILRKLNIRPEDFR